MLICNFIAFWYYVSGRTNDRALSIKNHSNSFKYLGEVNKQKLGSEIEPFLDWIKVRKKDSVSVPL